MKPLGEIETALWHGDYGVLADSHVHRATREDSLGIIKGRDAITAAWVAQHGLDGEVVADLSDMVVARAAAVGGQAAGEWHVHRWVWREEGHIVREIEVTDRMRDVAAPAVHPPLGELDAARGQFAARAEPLLPAGFPDAARQLASSVHRQWNGRDYSGQTPATIIALTQLLPDAVFMFEQAIVTETASALLFRIMGHHASGQRVRLIGSMTIIGGERTLVIDRAACAAQLERPIIDYGAG